MVHIVHITWTCPMKRTHTHHTPVKVGPADGDEGEEPVTLGVAEAKQVILTHTYLYTHYYHSLNTLQSLNKLQLTKHTYIPFLVEGGLVGGVSVWRIILTHVNTHINLHAHTHTHTHTHTPE